MIQTDPFWLIDYSILYNQERLTEFIPSEDLSINEKLNAIVRLSFYISFILFIIKFNYNVFLIPVFTALVTIYIFKFNNIKNEDLTIVDILENVVKTRKCQKPSEENPFMNTLLTDLDPDTEKLPACKPTEEVKEKIEKYFYKNLFRDVGDLYDKSNSQSRYFTMPDTSKTGLGSGNTLALANWCYKSKSNCKNDNAECMNDSNKYYEDLRRRPQFVMVSEENPLHNTEAPSPLTAL